MLNKIDSPLLSIIVPVFNVEKYLERCLDSILRQSFRDFEVICVNDGSTDGSLDIIKRYSSVDTRVKFINKQNGGLSSARNVALDIAKGRWILFVDSDDLLGKKGETNFDELSKIYSHLTEDVDWVIAKMTVFYDGDYKYKDISGDEKYFQLPKDGVYDIDYLRNYPMNVCACGKIYNKKLIDDNKLRFPEGLRYEDEYWYPCYLLLSKRVKVVGVELYSYYRHNNSIMGNSFAKQDIFRADEKLLIFENIIKFYDSYNLNNEDKLYLASRILGLYNSAIKSCPMEESLYIHWHAGKILRECDLDCMGDSVLQALKQGKVAPQPTKLSKLKKSIRKRLKKLKLLVI